VQAWSRRQVIEDRQQDPSPGRTQKAKAFPPGLPVLRGITGPTRMPLDFPASITYFMVGVARVSRRLIIYQNKIGARFRPALVRLLLSAIVLLCVHVHIPGAGSVFVDDAGAESDSSSSNLVSTVSTTAVEATVTSRPDGKQAPQPQKLITEGTGTSEKIVTEGTGTSREVITEGTGTSQKVVTEGTGTSGQPSAAGEEEAVSETVVDVMHAQISRTIQGTATWMDSFFGNRRYQSELNTSYVRFRENVFLQESTPAQVKPDLQVRIVLPQLRDKWHLVFAGTPKENTDFSAVQSSGAPADEQPTSGDQRAVAALDRTILQSAQQNFMVRGGFRLSNLKPVVILGPRYRVTFPLDSWTLRLIEEIVWTSNVGFASRSTVDLERPMPHDLFFRSTAELVHAEHQIGSIYAVSFVVGQPLGRARGLQYEWVNIFQTEPANVLTEIDLRVRYRQRLWRDWIYAEIAPQYSFPRTRGFKAVPGILFRVELTLGNYLHPGSYGIPGQ
jgi:hypothetical protein